MIIVKSELGHLVKVFHGLEGGLYGIHDLFGFVSHKACQDRLKHRKRKGLPLNRAKWRCLFNIDFKDDDIIVTAQENCKVTASEKKGWKMRTPFGNYSFVSSESIDQVSFEGDAIVHEGSEDIWRSTGLSILFFLILFLALLTGIEEVVEEEQMEPIEVSIVQDQKSVPIRKPTVAKAPKEMTPEQKAQRAVRQNLGFLGMLGTNKVKNVVGGAPTDLQDVSVGAGQGAAGSGGELISGLGKGVKKTSVGNTGVTGLGGIGTKGAGGGQGGYGSVSVASGEGSGISQIAVGDEVVLEGGLSKYAVQAAIAKYLNQVRACYEEGLAKRPGMMGTVRVNFQVGAAGNIAYSRVQRSSLGSPQVENCIVTKMKGWEFPQPKGGQAVTVNYPFLLRPIKS